MNWTKTVILAAALLIAFTGVSSAQIAPVLAPIGDQSVDENANLNFGVSATDADATTPTLTTSTLPTGATFSDLGDGTGTFDWTPDFTQSGPYPITFYATDGVDTDSELVTITVNNVNQAPILAAIGDRPVDENANLNFGISASDADGTDPTLTTSILPTGATFTDLGGGSGTFDWTPDFTQSGSYPITFYATDGVDTDSELVTITVNNVNQAPVLAAIGDRPVDENSNLNFGVSASDADGTDPTLTTSTLPTGATFSDLGGGTGTFDWTPDYTQSGSYPVTFYATDGVDTDSELVTITVNNVNQAPILAAIGDRPVDENSNLNFGVSASDADGTDPTLTTSTLPTGATFSDLGGGTGTFDWTPDFTQSGPYPITFYATDGVDTDSELVTITVNNVNRAPVLATIGPLFVTEGSNLNELITASDPDGTPLIMTISSVPPNATFTDNGNGTANFDFNPDYTQSDIISLTFYVNDGAAIDSELVFVTINEAGNQSPELDPIGQQFVVEGTTDGFTVTSSDPEGVVPSLTTSALPTNATFIDNGDGTGDFSFSPDFTQSGDHLITFYATDDSSAVVSELVTVTVTEAGNQAPILAAIGAQSVNENSNLTFPVSASDVDGPTLVLTTSTLPTGATFTDLGGGSGTFDWTPDFTQSGSYPVTFYASDGIDTDSEIVAITVNNVNQAPVLAAIGDRPVDENSNLNFAVSATDADGTDPTLTTSILPTGATFTDLGGGSGTFDWTPDFTQSGPYPITFYATDGVDTDSELVTITVNNVNQAPVLAAIGDRPVDENSNLNFGVSATDADGTDPTLTTSTLPTGATFSDLGGGTGTFDWTPDFTQSGSYPVTFYATDGVDTDSELVTITVNNVNQAPILAAIGDRPVDENSNLNFGVSASDADGVTPTLTTSTLPTGATFTDLGGGSGTFDWTPDFFQAGSYPVTFYATDGVDTDSELVTITVNNINRDPVLAAIGNQVVDENATLNLAISASDLDLTFSVLTTSTLPPNAVLTDNGDGTGGFVFNPDFFQEGIYDITFYADDGEAVDSELITITVNNINRAPVLDPVGPLFVDEGGSLNELITSSDADLTPVSMTISTVPPNATFTDNGDGTANFDFNPDYTQASIISVVFYVDDGVETDSELVFITINEAGNQAPVLAAIGAQSVTEGETLIVNASASDPDATIPSLSTSTLPTNASFLDNGDGTGDLTFSPDFTQAGGYDITFYASDGILVDSEIVTITVNDPGNQAPVLAAIGDRSIDENANLNFGVSATDADATTPTLTTSTLPTGATFSDLGGGTGTFDWTPDFTQSGSYPVTFYADDGVNTDSELVTITVNNVNRAPVLAAIGDRPVDENANLNFGVSATDADGTAPTLTTSTLPTGATFTDLGGGTGTFDWTPDFTQSGSYPVTFYATDGVDTDSELVTITVNNVNQTPILAAIGDRPVDENSNLNFGVSATDADGTDPTLTTSTLPTGATFSDLGGGNGTFDWTPDFFQAGSYPVTFYATDGVDTDSELVTITVNNV
ncbi:MAG: hypothetical protein DRP45_03395, partial [Candidatus Zixiibacteriota bacterium]